MKTWHIRRVTNMFRIDFGWYMLENVEGLFLFMLLQAWLEPVYVALLLHMQLCSWGSAYVDSCLRMWSYLHTWVLTCVRETLGRGLSQIIFTSFSIFSLLYATLTPLFVILTLDIIASFFFSLFLHRKHHFSSFSLESRI